jgi:hypothetical protein
MAVIAAKAISDKGLIFIIYDGIVISCLVNAVVFQADIISIMNTNATNSFETLFKSSKFNRPRKQIKSQLGTLLNAVFWDVTPCGYCKNRRSSSQREWVASYG